MFGAGITFAENRPIVEEGAVASDEAKNGRNAPLSQLWGEHMLILVGILLDGAITLGLGFVMASEWKTSPLFYASVVALHGLVGGFGILILVGVKALERYDVAAPEAITARRAPRVVPAFVQPRLDKAA